MLNVLFDLRFNGTESELRTLLENLRKKCDELDTVTSRIFKIENLRQYRKMSDKKLQTVFDNLRDSQFTEKEDKVAFVEMFSRALSPFWKKYDRDIIGFLVFVDVGSEPVRILLGNDKDDETNWSGDECLKDQYAEHFMDAHETICDVLKAGSDLGIVTNVEDRFEYYEKRDKDHAIKKWKELSNIILNTAKIMIDKKQMDYVDIGGKYRMTKGKDGEFHLDNLGDGQ